MGLRVEVALLFIISVVWIQHTLGDKWTCTCFIEDSNFVPANCSSSSCDCNPASGNRWTCICSTGRWPRLAENEGSCFTSCNCEGGPIKFDAGMSKKTILFIGFLILLLIVVVIPGIGIVALLLWNYCKHKRISGA